MILQQIHEEGMVFDIIFLDPPYKTDFAENAILQICKLNLIYDSSVVIWEHDNSKLNFINKNYPNAITKKYGEKYLTVLCYEDLKQ